MSCRRNSAQRFWHPLRAEIIARLANIFVDDIGLNFVARMEDETGATSAEIAICCIIVREVFNIDTILREIEALDNKISAQVQAEILYIVRRMCRRMTRWFLRARDRSWSIEENIKFFKAPVDDLNANLTSVLEDDDQKELKASIRALVKKKVPEELAEKIAKLSPLFSALDIVQVAHHNEMETQVVASVYYTLQALNLACIGSLIKLISSQLVTIGKCLHVPLTEDLEWQQRTLTAVL